MSETQTKAGRQPTQPTPRVSQKAAVSVVYVAALFLNIMDTTIVNVAIPTLGRQFHVAATHVDIVSIGYLVSLAVFIPASGWIGDRFGSKRTLLIAIATFTVASALCGAATSLGELVVFRVLQGAGGGMLMPVGMAMLYRTFPAEERVRLAGILMVPTAIAPALGPVLGGILVTDLSWRWAFYVNLPVGLAAIAFGLVYLREHREPSPGSFDLAGFGLAGIGFGSLMYGLSEGPSKGWSSVGVLAPISAGLLLLVTLVLVEHRKAEPLIDLRLYGNRAFAAGNVVITLNMTAFFGSIFLVSLFCQDGRGLSALDSGLVLFPEALGALVGSQVVSRLLYPMLGPRRLMAGGMAGIATFATLITLIGAHTNLWWMRGILFLLGYCLPHVLISTQAATFATMAPAATGRASTLFNAQRQMGSAIGVALVSTVVAAVGPTKEVAGRILPDLASYHDAFLTAAAVALVGALLALALVHDSDAEATMVRRGRRAAGPVSDPAASVS